MKKIITLICIIAVFAMLASALVYGKEIKLLYKSLNSFKDENLSNTFQNIYKIQPTSEVKRGNDVYEFQRQEENLPINFNFKGENFIIEDFLKETKTSGFMEEKLWTKLGVENNGFCTLSIEAKTLSL